VPDESTVRKNYVKQCYDLTIENIRHKIKEISVGSLNKNEQSTPYLLAVEQFDTTNDSEVSEFFYRFHEYLIPKACSEPKVGWPISTLILLYFKELPKVPFVF
jgi:hypothetical protein